MLKKLLGDSETNRLDYLGALFEQLANPEIFDAFAVIPSRVFSEAKDPEEMCQLDLSAYGTSFLSRMLPLDPAGYIHLKQGQGLVIPTEKEVFLLLRNPKNPTLETHHISVTYPQHSGGSGLTTLAYSNYGLEITIESPCLLNGKQVTLDDLTTPDQELFDDFYDGLRIVAHRAIVAVRSRRAFRDFVWYMDETKALKGLEAFEAISEDTSPLLRAYCEGNLPSSEGDIYFKGNHWRVGSIDGSRFRLNTKLGVVLLYLLDHPDQVFTTNELVNSTGFGRDIIYLAARQLEERLQTSEVYEFKRGGGEFCLQKQEK